MLKVALLVLALVSLVPTAGESAISPGCLPIPLPSEPVPPVITKDTQQLRFEIWRHPCQDGTDAPTLLRATPLTTQPFLCGVDFQLFQASERFDVDLRKISPNGSAFCEPVSAPTTLIVFPCCGHPFNDVEAYHLVYDPPFLTSPVTFDVPASSAPPPPPPASLAGAAILPGSRAVQVGHVATAFATIINGTEGDATDCTIAPNAGPPGSFSYQPTDPNTNVPIGTANTPVTIPNGGARTFVVGFTPSAAFAATTIEFLFDCANTSPLATAPGVNTLLLSASPTPTPDVVALGLTPTNDGIVDIPGVDGTGIFSIASVNVGAGSQVVVTADTGSATLPVTLTLCQTDPQSGACINPTTPGPSATVQMNANDTPTFALFVRGHGNVPFSPGVNRVFARFKTPGGATVGATSAAVRTQ